MYRLLSCSAVVICMALTPALAADEFEPSRRNRSINGCQRAKLCAASVGSGKRHETYGRDEAFIRQHGHLPGRKGAKLGSSWLICIGSV